MLRTNQPGAQGIDASDGLGGSLLVRPAEFADNGRLAGLAESQVSRAGTAAQRAHAAAHVLWNK
jgi:hypothetical protein